MAWHAVANLSDCLPYKKAATKTLFLCAMIGLVLPKWLYTAPPVAPTDKAETAARVNLLVAVLALSLLYRMEFRIVAAHLLLSLLLILQSVEWRKVLVVAVVATSFAGVFNTEFGNEHSGRFILSRKDEQRLRYREIFAKYIRFDPAGEGWDNTVYIASHVNDGETYLLAMPQGIGMSWAISGTGPARARYVLGGSPPEGYTALCVMPDHDEVALYQKSAR
jgi:hypothetical protein